jgi:hypothetical protein
MPYAIASTGSLPRPRSEGVVASERADSRARGSTPGGTLHATERMTAWTACGLAVEGLYLFDDLDWEATLVGGGRCRQCAVAIDDAD